MKSTITVFATLALFVAGCGKNPPMEDGTLRSHSGGFIDSHEAHIRSLGNQPIRMTDRVYRSAATMYLGAENVCVARDSRFEFHGPSWLGLTPLPQEAHDYWVAKIVQFYPYPLDEWFMERYGESGLEGMVHFRALTGADLIEMGAAVECTQEKNDDE